MRLTKRKAIELSIELWTWCAETGRDKKKWPGWKKYPSNYWDCFLCEYDSNHDGGCQSCPYMQRYKGCFNGDTPYKNWDKANDYNSTAKRKKYAAEFLAQLKTLLIAVEPIPAVKE